MISRVEIQQPSGYNQRNFMLCLSVFAGAGQVAWPLLPEPAVHTAHHPAACDVCAQ